MAIGRYFQPTPYEGQLYTPPLEVIAGALEKAQKQYDTNFMITEKLRNKYIEALPQDRARANQLQQSFEKQIDDVVAKYNGDYGAATSDLYKLTSNMTKAFSPGGEAYAIQSNYGVVQDSLKRERERLAKGEVTADQLDLLQSYYYKQNPTTFDKTTQSYSSINPLDLAKYVDEAKAAEEIISKVPTRKRKQDVFAGMAPNGDYMYETQEVEWKDPTETAVALDQGLFSNDAYTNYTMQLAQLAGIDPVQYRDAVRQEYINSVIPARTGIMSQSSTNKFVDNWMLKKKVDLQNSLTLEAVKQKNRKEMEDIKSGAAAMEGRPPSLLAIQKGNNSGLPDLPETMGTGQSNSLIKAALFPVLGIAAPFLGGVLPEEKSTPVNVGSLIKDYESGKQLPYQVNVPMLKSIKASHPNLPDSDIIKLYNDKKNGIQQYGEIHMDQYETTSSQREEAKRILPLISAGRVRIQKVNPDTGEVKELDADERISFTNSMQKAAKDKSPNFAALGKSRTASGKVFYGTVMADPNGDRNFYVIKEPRADIELVQEAVLDKAFGFLHKPNMEVGDPFLLNIGGQDTPIIGYKRYVDGELTPEYWLATRNSKGALVPDFARPDGMLTNRDQYGREYPIGPTELEKLILTQQDVHSTFPRETRPKFNNEINEE